MLVVRILADVKLGSARNALGQGREERSQDTSTARGEIMFKGPSVFSGYYKDEEKTAEVRP